MTAITRDLVEAFYRAYTARDSAAMSPFLADDVEWTISGPVDVLPFCGSHRGRQAVLDLVDQRIPAVFKVFAFVRDQLLTDGDRAATLHRISARTPDGRVISYRVAHFFRFADGKLVENLTLIDSFDAVEQVLGHPLSLHEAPPLAADDRGELVAL
jgi:ketosteroid isomerase-like protein